MASIEDVRREIARRELARREKDKARKDATQPAQDAARASIEPSAADNVKAFAANAASALAPDTSNMGLGLTAAVLPTSLPIMGAMRLARDALGVDERIDELGDKAPLAALLGTGAGTVAGLAGGKGPAASVARGAARGAGAAVGSGAAKGGDLSRALTKLADDSPILRGATALGTAGASEAVLGAAKVAGKVLPKRAREHPLVAMTKREKPDVTAYEATPEATSSPVPDLGKSGLARVLEDLVAPKKAAKSVEDVDYARAAEDFDPGAEGWRAWHEGVTPPSAVQALKEGKAQVAGTRVDRTPAPKTPVDLRAEAVERITAKDVGSDVVQPDLPPVKPVQVQDALEFLAQEEARVGNAAGRAWKSLPLSPVGQPKPPALGTEALRGEARAAVKAGESLDALAARLGLKKTDRELVAVFKAAQIGN